jgi:hypothetical protein
VTQEPEKTITVLLLACLLFRDLPKNDIFFQAKHTVLVELFQEY